MQDNFYLENLDDDSIFEFETNNLTRVSSFKGVISQLFSPYNFNEVVYNFLENHGIKISKLVCIYDSGNSAYRLERKTKHDTGAYDNSWLEEGVFCKLLKLGSKKWQTGKIRIRVSVEFIPDEPEIIEPESPLDDIRKKMAENNSI